MIPTKYIGYAKSIAKFVSAAGVTKIVHEIVENNIAPPTTTLNSIKIWTGTAVIASMIVSCASDHIDESIDEAVDTIAGVKKEFDAIQEEK